MKLLWNHRLVHWWLGTDALKLDTIPPGKFSWRFRIILERLICRFIEPLTTEHWLDHEILRKHLLNFGIDNSKIKVVPDKLNYPEPVKKIPHTNFNILFYWMGDQGNPKFKRWKYGYDFIEPIREYIKKYPDARLVIANGNLNMDLVYAITDIYIRPSRHDGAARMVSECKLNNIPVYFSRDGKPDLFEIKLFIDIQYKLKLASDLRK